MNRKVLIPAIVVVAALAAAAAVVVHLDAGASVVKAPGAATYTVARRDFVRSVRLTGTVEAVESTAIDRKSVV